MAHRRFREVTSLKLGFLPNLNRSVSAQDVLIGGGVGLVAAQGVKAVVGKFAPSILAQAEGTLGKFMPLATGIAAGAALYYGQRKSARGFGHAIGAAAVGLALTVREFLAGVSIGGMTFSEVTSLRLGQNPYGGFLVPDNTGRMNGLLVADNTDARLNELAAMSMAPDDDGIASLVG